MGSFSEVPGDPSSLNLGVALGGRARGSWGSRAKGGRRLGGEAFKHCLCWSMERSPTRPSPGALPMMLCCSEAGKWAMLLSSVPGEIAFLGVGCAASSPFPNQLRDPWQLTEQMEGCVYTASLPSFHFSINLLCPGHAFFSEYHVFLCLSTLAYGVLSVPHPCVLAKSCWSSS